MYTDNFNYLYTPYHKQNSFYADKQVAQLYTFQNGCNRHFPIKHREYLPLYDIYVAYLEVRIRPICGGSVAAQGRCISLDPLSLLQNFQPISLPFRSYSNGRYHGVSFFHPDYCGSRFLRNTAVYTISKAKRNIFCLLSKKVGVRFPSRC